MAGQIMLYGVNRKTKRSRKVARRARSHNRRRSKVRRKTRATTVKVFAPNPKRHKRRARVMKFRRNPKRRTSSGLGLSMPSSGNIMNMVKVATIASAGGVLLDIGYNYIPIPASLKTGPVSHLVKGAAAIGLAIVAKKFVGAKMANELAFGALTVTLYGALRAAANTALPSLKLGLYDDLGLYLDGGMHSSNSGGASGLGYYGAGMVSGNSIMSAGQPMDLQGEFRSF